MPDYENGAMRWGCPIAANLMVWLLLAGAAGSAVASTELKVLLDLDNNPATGCVIPTVDGPFAGAEQVLTTTVDPVSSQVVGLVLQTCGAGGVLGAPVPVTSPFAPPWAAGIGTGTGGSDVVETYVPLSAGAGPVGRLAFTSDSGAGGRDALLTTDGQPGGPPIVLLLGATAIPTLGTWSFALLVVLLLVTGTLLARHRGLRTGLWVALLGLTVGAGLVWAAIVLDGQTEDWDGIEPIATDPAGDAPGSADIRAVFARSEAGLLFFRFDGDFICGGIRLSPTSVPAGTLGAPYGPVPFSQTGGVAPITWTKTGALPAGISLSAAGVLSGTPTQGGSFPLTITATDARGCTGSQAVTLVIATTGPPAFSSANAATFTVGSAGSFTITATGVPPVTTIVRTGALPTGVTFTDNGNGTGTLTGTPAAGTAGSYALTFTASNGTPPDATQSFTLTVQQPNVACPVITVSGTLPALTFNTPMAAATFTQSGGNGTIIWSSSGLPTGTAIDPANGQVTGSPTVTGTFNVTITATDASACTGSTTRSVTVAPVAVGAAYSGLVDNTQFVITGGTTPSPATPFVGAAGRIITNDLPSGGVTATAGTFATTAGGNVTIAADGTFIYTPKANPGAAAITSDSFTYTVFSNTGGAAAVTSAPGTVNLTLAGRVWYVLNNGAAGNGQSQSTFNTLSAAVAASMSNDTIFVYQGTGTTANLATASVLKTGQSFIGQGVALVVNGNTLVTAGGFPLLGNTVTLASGVTVNGIDMTTGASNGIAASSVTGLSVTVRDLTTTTGTAVNIGGAGNSGTFLFRSISAGTSVASAATNGIVLTDITGSFTVTGDGTNAANGSGGTIQHMTGANGEVAGSGIYMSSAENVSLTAMNLHDFDNFAIYGTNITGFALSFATINGVNGNNNAGGAEEGSIRFDNLFGSAAISSSSISGGGAFNVFVLNTSGTLNRLTMANNTFGLISSTIGNDNVDVIARPVPPALATLNVTLRDNVFLGARGDHFEAIADGNSVMDVVVRQNKFTNGQMIIPGGGTSVSIRGDQAGTADTVSFDVSCNRHDGGHDTVGMFVAKGNGGGTWSGSVVNNVIGPPTPSTANADGLFVRATGSNTITVLIRDNNISGYGNEGLHLQNNDGSVTMNATIFHNTLSAPNASNFAGLFVDNGATASGGGDTSTANVVVGSASAATKQNTLAGSGKTIDVSLSNFNSNTVFNLSKNGSASGTATGVIQDDNVDSPSVDTSGGTGPITLVTDLPTTPAVVADCTVPAP